MSENENIDDQPCCASGNCSPAGAAKDSGKMKYAAFGFVMLLAVGVAANALIEKHKGVSASTCGTNACTICPSQLGGSGTCGDSDNCTLAPATKETDACGGSAGCGDNSSCSPAPTPKETNACGDSGACGDPKTCGVKAETDGAK